MSLAAGRDRFSVCLGIIDVTDDAGDRSDGFETTLCQTRGDINHP
jgi:hypothetical protein